MTPSENISVIGPGGLRGTIDTATWPLDGSRADVLVQLESGESVLVPFTALLRQDDGSYRLTLDPTKAEPQHQPGNVPGEQVRVLPVIEESLDVEIRPVETARVRVHKVVHEREAVVDPPLLREEVVVERVPVNRIVEGPMSVRSEGDTLIIPVLEEVLVVEKRLLLKEEVRLTKHRGETHMPQRVMLRHEEAIVERIDREGHEDTSHIEEHRYGEDSHRSV